MHVSISNFTWTLLSRAHTCLFTNLFLLHALWEPFKVDERLKVKCPSCGISGFLQVRGTNVMVQHYQGFRDNRRIYIYHKVPYELFQNLQVNASKTMQVNSPNNNLLLRNMAGEVGFEPTTPNLGGWCSIQKPHRRPSTPPRREAQATGRALSVLSYSPILYCQARTNLAAFRF